MNGCGEAVVNVWMIPVTNPGSGVRTGGGVTVAGSGVRWHGIGNEMTGNGRENRRKNCLTAPADSAKKKMNLTFGIPSRVNI